MVHNDKYEMDLTPEDPQHGVAQSQPVFTPLPEKDITLRPEKPDAFVRYLAYEVDLALSEFCL